MRLPLVGISDALKGKIKAEVERIGRLWFLKKS
jgi:hypothetical protein